MLPTGPWCIVGIMSIHLLITWTGRGWSNADHKKINHRGEYMEAPWELCKSVNDIHWKIIHNLWQSVGFPFRPLSSKRYGAGNMRFFIDSPGEHDSPRRTSFGIFPSHSFNNLQYWFETESRAVKSPGVVHCFHLMVYWSAALALCTAAEDTYESIHCHPPGGGLAEQHQSTRNLDGEETDPTSPASVIPSGIHWHDNPHYVPRKRNRKQVFYCFQQDAPASCWKQLHHNNTCFLSPFSLSPNY